MSVAEVLGAALDEWDAEVQRAYTLTGRLNELVTDLETAAADLEDPKLSAAVAAIRKPLIDAGNRLTQLRRHD